jgi:phage tail-like protein
MDTSVSKDKTRLSQDPIRNFKFQVDIFHPDDSIKGSVAKMGFTAVDGLNMSTEMIPYREGGWNTNPHKMPGLTDFSPVTLSSGVFYDKPGMWDLARQMFSINWGGGTLAADKDYRFDMLIRVYDHPVTKGPGTMTTADLTNAVIAFQVRNAWVANVAFSGLDSLSNSIMVSNMTVHHEGLEVFWGKDQVRTMTPNAATSLI